MDLMPTASAQIILNVIRLRPNMLDELLLECSGRELLDPNDLSKNEFGVKLRSGQLCGYYAFKERHDAESFQLRGGIDFTLETGGAAFLSDFSSDGFKSNSSE